MSTKTREIREDKFKDTNKLGKYTKEEAELLTCELDSSIFHLHLIIIRLIRSHIKYVQTSSCHNSGGQYMARTWRKGFILFAIILIFTTSWRVFIPSHDYGTATRDLNGSLITSRDDVWNANRQNVTLSQQPGNPSIEDPNHIDDWSQTNQTATYRNLIRHPTPLQPHYAISIASVQILQIKDGPVMVHKKIHTLLEI
jgi:hypothetical protein